MKHLADGLTLSRMVLSAVLLFVPVFSCLFYILYVLCGLTDMVDGTVARKTGTAGRRGAVLDSAADAIFVAVCLAKLLPQLTIPAWLWFAMGGTALLRLINLLWGVRRSGWVIPHTVGDKVAGTALFLLPLTWSRLPFVYGAAVVSAIAFFAAVQEACFLARQKEA